MTQNTPEVFDHKTFLRNLTTRPGVYRMYSVDKELLYVGKAKNLKNRVSSYFRSRGLTNKTVALVSRIHSIEITITHSETEALLLEQTLIKNHRPPYNILLVDDKSYPYIKLTSQHQWPGLYLHRGARSNSDEFYGPFPSASAVRESLVLLQKAFRIRQCEDAVFENRNKPCLQYQIKRCKAPCVGYVSKEEIDKDLAKTRAFLKGKSQDLIHTIEKEMDSAAASYNYEQAAEYRDQLLFLRKVQEQQYVAGGKGNVDVFAVVKQAAGVCIHFLMVRDGRMIGSRSFFPKPGIEENESLIMAGFLAQYYLAKHHGDCPSQILSNVPLEDARWLEAALKEQYSKTVTVQHAVRSTNAKWLELAKTNAAEQLQLRMSHGAQITARLEALQEALSLEKIPERIECFDISHSSGEATTASCVVFDQDGPNKSLYRKFNIEDVTAGDDYAAMSQAIHRRYSRLQKEGTALPDLLIVDGGKGQMNMALDVMQGLAISIPLLGVAKGETRKPGMETLFFETTDNVVLLPNHSQALHLIQHIRDEAHRFAITGHRARRGKARIGSVLDDIPQVGPGRRRSLIRHFGSALAVKSASVEEIAKVSGISKSLAQSIYDYLHST
ncbi:excinuclease ABC subunit UvrC [Reinekea marinisedimentorum]|uniref:UvrABC system protein C n=1 Tax=Reinekea marinisedimentorum TaxID=230495 RepID=A0A4R3I8Y6_9GAMM|nr:excinuclease ABC subunit UvrC [Reinekea marinisedimentorum]TCS42604.1 excinuclease ABC subunit C [Reinekea marinisedimentorum]